MFTLCIKCKLIMYLFEKALNRLRTVLFTTKEHNKQMALKPEMEISVCLSQIRLRYVFYEQKHYINLQYINIYRIANI